MEFNIYITGESIFENWIFSLSRNCNNFLKRFSREVIAKVSVKCEEIKSPREVDTNEIDERKYA